MKTRTKAAAVLAMLCMTAVACQPPIAIISKNPDTGVRTGFYNYELKPIPHKASKDGGSNVRGQVVLEQNGTSVRVKILATGLSGNNLPHAQHIHGALEKGSVCPTIKDDKDGNGLIDTVEGVPSYGGVLNSLTTKGDSSADSALAVTRFPVTINDGVLVYNRVIEVSEDVAANLEKMHVVLHGIDINNNGKYDFDAGKSSLDPSLPLEATVPAACGGLKG